MSRFMRLTLSVGFWITAAIFAAAATSLAADRPAVRLNEVMFDPDGQDAGREWVELCNSGTADMPLEGWTLVRRDGRILATLPKHTLPAQGFFVVRLTSEVLNNSSDELGLYRGAPSAQTMVDFVAYAFDVKYVAGKPHDHAVAAKIWAQGAAFSAGEFVSEGNSIGRDPLGADHGEPSDWYGDGGVQARGPTPGRANESPLGYLGGAQVPLTWPLLVFGQAKPAKPDKRKDAQDMLLKVIAQIRGKHMDLLGRNGDAGMGDAPPVIQDKSDGNGGQKGDVVVGNVRFRFGNKLSHEGNNAGGLAHVPEQPDGEVLIELSLSATDNVDSGDTIGDMAEWKLKEIVIHELAHAAHFHDLQSGYWRTRDGRTEPTAGSRRDDVRQVDELQAYLTNLDLLRRLMDEFPDDVAAIENRYVAKVKIIIQKYLTTGGGHKGVVEVIEDFKGTEPGDFGDHLRDEVLEQVRNLIQHKVYAFLIQNKGGPLTKAQLAELAKERDAFNGVTPAGTTPLTSKDINDIIKSQTEDYKKRHPEKVVEQPPPKPNGETPQDEKARLAGVRSQHDKLKERVKSLEEYVKDVEDLRDKGTSDDKTVENGKTLLDGAKKDLKDFEDANSKDLEELKIKRVTSLGAAAPRTTATLVTQPTQVFQTREGQQAYAVLEEFARAGDLRSAVTWGSQVANQRESSQAAPSVPVSANQSRTLAELQQVADLSALVDTAARTLVARAAALQKALATSGATPEGFAQVLSAPPPAANLAVPESLAPHVDVPRFFGTVFDQFAPEILRQATQTAQPGAQVTKGGAVLDASGPHSAVATVKITFDDATPPAPDAPANTTSQTSVVKTDADGRFQVTVPAGKTVRDVQIGGEQLAESTRSNASTSGLPLRLDLSPQVWESLTYAERAERLATGTVLLDVVRHQLTGSIRLPALDDQPSSEFFSALQQADRTRSLIGQYALERLVPTGAPPGKQPDWLADSLTKLADTLYQQAIKSDAERRRVHVEQWLATTTESLAKTSPDPAATKQALADEAQALRQRDAAFLEFLKLRMADVLERLQPSASNISDLPPPDTLDVYVTPTRPLQVVVVTPSPAAPEQLQALVKSLDTTLQSAVGPNRLEFGAGPVESRSGRGDDSMPANWYVFEFTVRGPGGGVVTPDSTAIEQALGQLQASSPNVAAIELAQPRTAEAPSDPHFTASGGWGQEYADQWALRKIGLDPADPQGAKLLERLPTGQPCIVAVVGSGVDWTHPELLGQMWINIEENPYNGIDDDGNGYIDDQFGWNFRDDTADVLDRGGHDTHVAGVIGARWNNRRGIVGVNPQARMMALKTANYLGQSCSIDIGRAIFYAVDRGARVINISYSGSKPSAFEQLAIDYAAAHGVLVVAAVGNQAADAQGRGVASARGVLTVAGVGVDGVRAPFSNWGQPVTLAAPAMDILGLRARGSDFLLYVGENPNYVGETAVVGKDRDLYRASGTSFAAPLVSGAASLLISRNPRLTARQVRNQLLMSAADADVPGWDQNTGAGLLDLRAALDADPDYFLLARIAQVRAVRRGGRLEIEVSGQSEGTAFVRREVQIAFGNSPAAKAWTTVETAQTPQPGGVLAFIPTRRFSSRGTWSIRLVSHDQRKTTREARATLDTQ